MVVFCLWFGWMSMKRSVEVVYFTFIRHQKLRYLKKFLNNNVEVDFGEVAPRSRYFKNIVPTGICINFFDKRV